MQNNWNDNDLEETVVDFEIEFQQVRASITTSAISIMSDDEINSLIRSLNPKQRQVFNVLTFWSRKTLMNYSSENAADIRAFTTIYNRWCWNR